MIGIGIDCEQISRFENYSSKEVKFLAKIFTLKEIEYCKSKNPSSQHFAVRFAAKEAVRKCTEFLSQVPLNCIEVISDEMPPHIRIKYNNLKPKIKISLTHSGEMAIAVAALISL